MDGMPGQSGAKRRLATIRIAAWEEESRRLVGKREQDGQTSGSGSGGNDTGVLAEVARGQKER